MSTLPLLASVLAQPLEQPEAVGSTGEQVAFWVLAPLATLAALGMLLVRKAVHSALLLAVVMISLAVLYLGQEAPFLGVVQVVVYTGAIMMLFLFVLMLVGVDSSDSLVETLRGHRVASLVAGLAFGALLVLALGNAVLPPALGLGGVEQGYGGHVEGIAELLFVRYVVAFELTAALLITAAMAAMVLTHREALTGAPSQRERSDARFRPGGHPTPLPSPGVYARHNAVDTPALLPDGSPSELSISATLRSRGVLRPATPEAEPTGEVARAMRTRRDSVGDAGAGPATSGADPMGLEAPGDQTGREDSGDQPLDRGSGGMTGERRPHEHGVAEDRGDAGEEKR